MKPGWLSRSRAAPLRALSCVTTLPLVSWHLKPPGKVALVTLRCDIFQGRKLETFLLSHRTQAPSLAPLPLSSITSLSAHTWFLPTNEATSGLQTLSSLSLFALPVIARERWEPSCLSAGGEDSLLRVVSSAGWLGWGSRILVMAQWSRPLPHQAVCFPTCYQALAVFPI